MAAYHFCTGQTPPRQNIRILDAGCGTGVGTEYLIHLNREAEIIGIDISEKALEIAQERCQKSGVAQKHQHPITFRQLNLEEAHQLEGEFDLINCVGVLHHLPDPIKGIQGLAQKLAPGGIFHIFVYAELGRREIQLMQEAIALLQGNQRGNYQDGVFVGRQLFKSLPQDNRIVQEDRKRWSLENHRDESFADMYVHPQETDYNVYTLKELIDASGLQFLGFSNPQYWQLDRLIGSSDNLLERAKKLNQWDYFRLIELLDPELTHYEFFLGKPPLVQQTWSEDGELLKAIPERHPCLFGWESKSLLNYDYQPVTLTDQEFAFMKGCDSQESTNKTVEMILEEVNLSLDEVRSLQQRQLIILGSPQ